ncbi:MAG: hypothetical protein ABIO70_36620 [Pseudomonadota bacterium]
MLHYAAHAFPPDYLFTDWREARQLWDRLLALGPPRALMLMPDHVHLIIRELDQAAWVHFMRGYACWRNHHRDESGRRVWLPTDPPQRIESSKHLSRTLRYVALNPCRDQLVADPLAWAFSSYRDAVGFGVPPVVPVERDPGQHHAYVSGDPTVRVEGTDLPCGLRGLRTASVAQVTEAVSALTRTPVEDLRRRGQARGLLVQGLLAFCGMPARAVAREVGLSHTAVLKLPLLPSGVHDRLERVLGDPRFSGLYAHDLSMAATWRRYREGRERRGVHAALLQAAGPRLRVHR